MLRLLLTIAAIITMAGCQTSAENSVVWDDLDVTEKDNITVGAEYAFEVSIIRSEWLPEKEQAVAAGILPDGNYGVGLIEYNGDVLEVGCTYRVRGTYITSVGKLSIFAVFDVVERLGCNEEEGSII